MEVSIACNWPFEFLLDPDVEQVGVLLGRKGRPGKTTKVLETYYSPDAPGQRYTVLRIVPVPNVHTDPTHHYAVALADLQAVLREAEDDHIMLGMAHTHPPDWTGDPSVEDIEGLPAIWIGAVVSMTDETVRWFAGRKGTPSFGKD